jgi:hypothetical protein
MNLLFKARMLFFITAIFALFGGTYAFVINRGGLIYCSTTSSTSCTLTKQNFTITPLPPGVLSYCTDIYGDPCTTRTLITAVV